MFDRTELVKIISGQRRGVWAAIIRFCLGCLTPVYRLGVGLRNRRFDRATAHPDAGIIQIAGIPVVSVGNLTTGGTGKTPLVIWIASFLQQHGLNVVLISRGYGSSPREDGPRKNDEAMEMENRLPNVPHLQSPDRYAMSQQAINQFGAQVIVLDDAFQHRRLHRDLDIVLIDATVPFGYGRLLPRGLLREPLKSLRRADLIVLTRSDLVADEQRERILRKIQSCIGSQPILESRTVAAGLVSSQGNRITVEELSGQPVFYFCGIGNPNGFATTLNRLGLDVRGSRIFSDHHDFSAEDMHQIGELATTCGAAVIVCTHKDLVKLRKPSINTLPVYALVIDIEFLHGQSKLESALTILSDQAKTAAG